MNIEWVQVLIAFFLGVFMSAMVRGLIGTVQSKVTGG